MFERCVRAWCSSVCSSVVFERFVTKIRRTSLVSLTHRKSLDYNEKTQTPTQVHMVVDQVSQTDLGVVLVRGVLVRFHWEFHYHHTRTQVQCLHNDKDDQESQKQSHHLERDYDEEKETTLVWKRLREELYPTIQKILQHQEIQAKTVERLVRDRKEEEAQSDQYEEEEEEEKENDEDMLPPGITIPTVRTVRECHLS